MGKLKFQGGITKLFSSKIGELNKKKFTDFIGQDISAIVKSISATKVLVSIVSFSSRNDFPEQVLSILSFLRYSGVPSSWTIYSDGSHTAEQKQLLVSIFAFVVLEERKLDHLEKIPGAFKNSLNRYKPFLLDYAKSRPLGKKLLYYLNHEVTSPTLFIDSDILFYQKSFVLNCILKENFDGWYLPDADWGSLDSRYKQKNSEQLYQVNSGLFLLNKNIAVLEAGLDFLESLESNYEYFSEQTVMHILFRANGFYPLDPRLFVLNISDQFDFSYAYDRESIAVRHYTGPVRHKMWQKDWKWHLSL